MFRPRVGALAYGFLLFTFVISTDLHAQDLSPNGIGVYSEFGVTQYAFRLELEFLTDTIEPILDQEMGKKLSIRVLAPTVTNRQWSKFWIQNISINSSPSALETYAEPLIQMTSLFKGDLIAGDLIEIHQITPDRTDIRMNDLALATLTENRFFEFLMLALIGPVPPSSEVKAELLKQGDITGNAIALFDSSSPLATRQTTVSSWITPSVDEEDAAVLAEETVAETATPEEISDVNTTTSTSEAALTTPETPELVAAEESVSPQDEQEPTESSVEIAEEETLIEEISEPATEEPLLTAAMILEAQEYTSRIVNRIYSQIRYPDREMELGREGSNNLRILIARDGSLVSAQLSQEANYSAFNKATLNAATKSFPVEPLPPGILEEPYELNIPISYRLQ